jgi:hypothetical protein
VLAGAEAEADAASPPVGSQGIFHATDTCTVIAFDDSTTACRCAVSLGGVDVGEGDDVSAQHSTSIDVASRTLLTSTPFEYTVYVKREVAADPAATAFLVTVVCCVLSLPPPLNCTTSYNRLHPPGYPFMRQPLSVRQAEASPAHDTSHSPPHLHPPYFTYFTYFTYRPYCSHWV